MQLGMSLSSSAFSSSARQSLFVRKARWSPVCAPPLGGDPWRSPFFVLVPDYPRYWLSPLGFSLLQRHEHLLLGSSSPLAASSPSGWLPGVLRGRSVFRPSQRVCSRRSCSRALVMLECPTIRCSQPLPAPRSAVADLWRYPAHEHESTSKANCNCDARYIHCGLWQRHS